MASVLMGAALSSCAITALAGSAHAQRACSFTAFVEESDPAGLNVRAGPSSADHIVGRLPPVWIDHATGLWVRVKVDVTKTSNGWFLIRNAQDDEDLTGHPARPMYTGEGWVSGKKLVVKSEATIGRQSPRRDAPEAVRLPEGYAFDSDALVTASRPVDCEGGWAQVEVDEARLPATLRSSLKVVPSAREGAARGRFRAWVDEICGIQETSCDGP